MLSTLGLLGMGMAGGLGLAWWRSRSRNRMDWEGLANQGLMRLDAQGCVRELGSTAAQILGFERRCDQAHLDDLPLVGLSEWLSELEADRTAGLPMKVTERDLVLESCQWAEGRLLPGKQELRCRFQPMKAQGSLLPAWMGLSVVLQKKEEEAAETLSADNCLDASDQACGETYDLAFLEGVTVSRKLHNEGFEGPGAVLTPHLDPTIIERYRIASCTDQLQQPFESREPGVMVKDINKQTAASLERARKSDHRLDDPEFMELINEFVTSLDERLQELETALESSDWKKIETVSHRLADTAEIYRMSELSILGADIEKLVLAEPGSSNLSHKVADLRTAIHGISGHQLIQEPRE